MPRKVEGLENFKKILELPTWANVETFFISMNELALPKL